MTARPALSHAAGRNYSIGIQRCIRPNKWFQKNNHMGRRNRKKKRPHYIPRGGGGSRFDNKSPTSSRCLLRRNDVERIFGAKLGHLCNTAQREREVSLLRGIRSTRTRKHNKNNTKGCYTPKTHDVTWGSVRAYPCIVPPPALTPPPTFFARGSGAVGPGEGQSSPKLARVAGNCSCRETTFFFVFFLDVSCDDGACIGAQLSRLLLMNQASALSLCVQNSRFPQDHHFRAPLARNPSDRA